MERSNFHSILGLLGVSTSGISCNPAKNPQEIVAYEYTPLHADGTQDSRI